MDHAALKTLMPSLVADHLPRNARSAHYKTYDGIPKPSPIGIRLDPQPFHGTVIAKTDEAIIVKTGRVSFAALDRDLITDDPEPSAKITVVPYARRNFDGERIDKPIEEIERMTDGREYTVQTVRLGGGNVKLPVERPRCPELADLIGQLEELPAPDGFRQIAHLLVDAGARSFSCVDPAPENIADTPPEIAFEVGTSKFKGRVAIRYDRSLDLYAVELRHDEEVIRRVDRVDFTSLGATLEELIDDGAWRRIEVTVTGQVRKRTRH